MNKIIVLYIGKYKKSSSILNNIFENKEYEQYRESIIEILFIKIMNAYINEELNRKSKLIEELYNLELAGYDRVKLFRLFTKEINEDSYLEDIAVKIFINNLNSEYDKLQSKNHLCSNCLNATPKNCYKVKDVSKKKIEKYLNITDGYQVLSSSGKILDFTVTSCLNYVDDKEYQKKKTIK